MLLREKYINLIALKYPYDYFINPVLFGDSFIFATPPAVIYHGDPHVTLIAAFMHLLIFFTVFVQFM